MTDTPPDARFVLAASRWHAALLCLWFAVACAGAVFGSPATTGTAIIASLVLRAERRRDQADYAIAVKLDMIHRDLRRGR